ncbi:MAG: Gp138 family membrane-puncturing spike protein [Fusobacteriaceae bacterium]
MIGEKLGADIIRKNISKGIDVIETMFVATVISVDEKRMRYSVRPLIKSYDEILEKTIESPNIFECPMMISKSAEFYIRIPYAVGDVVYVGCSKESIDQALSSSVSHENKIKGVRQYRKVDGVILGGLLADDDGTLSSSNSKDLLIQNRKTNDKIVLVSGGGIELDSPSLVKIITPKLEILSPETTMSGNLTVTGNITGEANLNITGAGQIGSVTTKAGVTLDTHTHAYNPGPGAPTSTTPGKG